MFESEATYLVIMSSPAYKYSWVYLIVQHGVCTAVVCRHGCSIGTRANTRYRGRLMAIQSELVLKL